MRANRTGASSVTSHDIARAAGVSQSTVSRALRGDARVAEATRTRVLEVARELRYIPSEIARSLSTRSTRRIGMVVTGLTNPFYPYLVGPLHDELEGAGYRLLLFAERGEQDFAKHLVDQSIDGVVLTTSTLHSDLAQDLHERGLPFVYLNRTADNVPGDSVVVDSGLGASLVAAEFARLGHSRIAAILGPIDSSTGRDRERGFRVALEAAGIDLPQDLVRHGPYDFETGYSLLPELLDSGSDRPTAVFCGNDSIAIGAMNAARKAQHRIPGDVSLVGFDNIPMANWEVFQLTTVHTPTPEMAKAAARLLVERIEATPASAGPRHLVFEPRLVRRATLSAIDAA